MLGDRCLREMDNRGEKDRRVKLGCVLPNEAPAVFGDALPHLAQAATDLYQDTARYWYATQQTVTKLADDRASSCGTSQTAWVRRSVVGCGRIYALATRFRRSPVSSTLDRCTDEMEVWLVVLNVEIPYARKAGTGGLKRRENLSADEETALAFTRTRWSF